MTDTEYNKMVERLQKINKIISMLDPSIRSQSFDVLKKYVEVSSSTSEKAAFDSDGSHEKNDVQHSLDIEGFISTLNVDKPSDNALAIVAIIYSEYGSAPFTSDDILKWSCKLGLTIPDRLDMTLKNAQSKNKKLFSQISNGKYKPTVHGESHLKRKYGVSKGRRAKIGA